MSYRVLARKYRPQNLEELVGQETLVNSLKHAFESNRIPHAFLLHGIRGVGKTTTARIIAKSLNCTGPDGSYVKPPLKPCDVCVSCKGITNDRHMDVIEIDAASHTGVDDIREITEASKYKAVQGRFKVFIIDEVHMLSKAAFNALLKTLEEPPAHVKFIFATTEIKKIPDTILSRCLRFDLNVMQPTDIVTHLKYILSLENSTAEDDALAMIARAADGSMRDALSLLDQAIMLEGETEIKAATVSSMLGMTNRDSLFTIYEQLFNGNVDVAIAALHDLYQKGASPLFLVQDLIDILYWVICLKQVPRLTNDKNWPEGDRIQGNKLAQKLPMSILLQSWDLMQKTYDDVLQSYQPSQALDVGLMRLIFVKDILGESSQNAGNVTQGGHENKAPMQNAMPQTFEALVNLFLEAKEGVLHGYLLHDTHLIAYEPGKIIFGVTPKVPKNFATTLKAVCERLTNHPWVIEIKDNTSMPTLAQMKAIEHEKQREEVLQHPLIQEIFNTFPKATVTIH